MTNGLREKLYAQSISQIGRHLLMTAEINSIFGIDQAIALGTMRGHGTVIRAFESMKTVIRLPRPVKRNRL